MNVVYNRKVMLLQFVQFDEFMHCGFSCGPPYYYCYKKHTSSFITEKKNQKEDNIRKSPLPSPKFQVAVNIVGQFLFIYYVVQISILVLGEWIKERI